VVGDAGRPAEGSVLGPDALACRYIGDWRALLGAGRALLIELAHPALGAAVLDHSRFKADRWGRIWATLDSLMLQVYSGDRALAESAACASCIGRSRAPTAAAAATRPSTRTPTPGSACRSSTARSPSSAAWASR